MLCLTFFVLLPVNWEEVMSALNACHCANGYPFLNILLV